MKIPQTVAPKPVDKSLECFLTLSRNRPQLERFLPTLARDAEIVAYCRGPYCVYAHQAVATLRRHGLNARRLEGGLPEWREDGRPVLINAG